jgi:hypothetical protein
VNVSIHGITEEDVRDAPLLPAVYECLRRAITDTIVVCHTPFDSTAIRQALDKYSLPRLHCHWLDSARVTRRIWPEFARRGYGLGNVAKKLGISFDHHVAEEDARAAGQIVLTAIAESGFGLEEWLVRAARPMAPIAQEGNPDGALFGEVVVFTGALSMPRREAAALAAAMGCKVADGVTKETTLLVHGVKSRLRGGFRPPQIPWPHRRWAAATILSSKAGRRISRRSAVLRDAVSACTADAALDGATDRDRSPASNSAKAAGNRCSERHTMST